MNKNYDPANDPYPLTPEQIAGVKKARASMRTGKFASDEEIERIFGQLE